MKTSLEEIRCSELLKRDIQAIDGDIGSLSDVLFDDETWSVRYFVVKTGGWLSGRKVLVLPHSLIRSEFPGDSVPVQLTKQQIEDSPDVDTDRPVSRQHEAQLGSYYGLPPLPPPPMGFGMIPAADGMYAGSSLPNVPVDPPPGLHEDPHLQSVRSIVGYEIQANGEAVGKVEDLTIDWKVMQMTSILVDTSDAPGSRVAVLPVNAVRRIRWEEHSVEINWSRLDVERAPGSVV